MSEWISVEDKVPDILDDVLATNESGSVFEASYWAVGEFVSKFRIGRLGIKATHDDTVTHWMPLPEPPQE